MTGRSALLGNGLSTAEEGGPGCTWTDADLALALDLLGLPPALHHLDDRLARVGSLRAEARSGSEGAVAELRELIAGVVAELEERDEEAWVDIERPRLEGSRAGVEIDLKVPKGSGCTATRWRPTGCSGRPGRSWRGCGRSTACR